MVNEQICWMIEWDAAFAEACGSGKPVLIVAKEPENCIGCNKLDAYTYP